MSSAESLDVTSEFAAFSVEAVWSCLGQGAAKLAGVISPDSVQNLKGGVPRHIDLLLRKVPELSGLIEVLNLATKIKKDPGMARISSIKLIPVHEEHVGLSHTDSTIRYGLSALLPFAGGRAQFMADNEEFDLDEVFPHFVANYGPRDVMLVRQAVEYVNGWPINLRQAWHCGNASEYRQVVAIDFHTQEIEIDELD